MGYIVGPGWAIYSVSWWIYNRLCIWFISDDDDVVVLLGLQ